MRRAGGRAGRRRAWDRSTCSSGASSRPRAATSKTSSTRSGRTRNAPSASPRSTAFTASSSDAVYVTSPGDCASTSSDVELPFVAREERDAPVAPVEDGRRMVARPLVQVVQRGFDVLMRRARAVDARGEAVRGEDHQAGVGGAHEHHHHVAALGSSNLLVVRERGLVAVVAVGDQQAAVGERVCDRRVVEPPEPRSLDLDLRLTVGHVEGRLSLVEEEDRLELRPGRAQKPQAPLLRAAVRSLMRQDDPVLVRLDSQRSDEPRAPAGDAVGPDVVLRQRPEGRRLRSPARPPRSSCAAPRRPRPPNPGASGGRRCTGCGRDIRPAPRARSRRREARRDPRAGRHGRGRSEARETA